MYRTHTYTPGAIEDAVHAVVSNLIHRGGWTFVDAYYDGGQQTEWPLPTEATPAMANGDFVVISPPDAALAATGDVFWIEMTDSVLEVMSLSCYRMAGLATSAWDAGTGTPTVGSVQLTSVLLDLQTSPPDKVAVFSSTSALVVALLDTTTNSVIDGHAFGYLESAVNDATGFGAGTDPAPVCQLRLINTTAAGPGASAWLDAFGLGFVFDETTTPIACAAGVNFMAQAPVGDEILLNPITYGGGVPRHVLARCVVSQGASPAQFVRGVFTNVCLTSAQLAEQVVEERDNGDQYIVLGARVAVGPL